MRSLYTSAGMVHDGVGASFLVFNATLGTDGLPF
jgi:hypothetical protein